MPKRLRRSSSGAPIRAAFNIVEHISAKTGTPPKPKKVVPITRRKNPAAVALGPVVDRQRTEPPMRTGPMSATALVLMVSVACGHADRRIQDNSVQSAQLDSAIGPADAKLFKSVRDWANPLLLRRPDGTEITLEGILP